MVPDGRTRHYGHFYGLEGAASGAGAVVGEVGADVWSDDGRPVVAVVGNCQAEAVRLLLGHAVRSLRIPPVFELTATDLPHLAALLARADVLLCQPIRADYRGLPLGTDQLAALLPPGARVVRYPAIRFAGLYPTHAVVRSEHGDPPGVPYLDLATVVEVATGTRPTTLPAHGVRDIARASRDELHQRERAADAVSVSDILLPARGDECQVVNHPGNRILTVLAERILDRLGLPPGVPDPGRVLLGEVWAPLRPEVVDALGLHVPPRPHWTLRGETLPDDAVARTQRDWLHARPDLVTLALTRHAPTLRSLRW